MTFEVGDGIDGNEVGDAIDGDEIGDEIDGSEGNEIGDDLTSCTLLLAFFHRPENHLLPFNGQGKSI